MRPSRAVPIGDPAPSRGASLRAPSRPAPAQLPPGPFRAEHVREGDHYEISRGHPVQTMPSGGRHAAGTGYGFEIADSDPNSVGAAVDLGLSRAPGELRAPDVAVTPHTNVDGWVSEFPPLAIEYAGRYQEEAELREKIKDLIAGGTRHVWVVRLKGAPRVEVHEPLKPMREVQGDELLSAPGVLRNPVLAKALWDREAAHEHTLRNLMQRRGYADLEAALSAAERQGEARGEARGEALGAAEGLRIAIRATLQVRGLSLTEAQAARLGATQDRAELERWLHAALAVQVERD